MIAPIVDGAGVKVKVAEALYNRVPIAATSFAVRGLPLHTRSAIRICDSPQDWIAFLNGMRLAIWRINQCRSRQLRGFPRVASPTCWENFLPALVRDRSRSDVVLSAVAHVDLGCFAAVVEGEDRAAISKREIEFRR